MLQVKSFEFNPIQENTYILYNAFNDCAIIDPGCYAEEERQEMVDFIESHQLKPKWLLNTHCHLDHVFGNKFIAGKYNLKLQIHPGEQIVLDAAVTSGLMFNLPFDNYQGEIEFLQPGSSIQMGEDRLDILFTPGHSPASLSFYHAAAGFVLSGDALFYRSIGRTDLPGGNLDVLLNSIRTTLFTLPADTRVYSGHGPVTRIGDEIKYNPYLQ